jgi:hypothetical protein
MRRRKKPKQKAKTKRKNLDAGAFPSERLARSPLAGIALQEAKNAKESFPYARVTAKEQRSLLAFR